MRDGGRSQGREGDDRREEDLTEEMSARDRDPEERQAISSLMKIEKNETKSECSSARVLSTMKLVNTQRIAYRSSVGG